MIGVGIGVEQEKAETIVVTSAGPDTHLDLALDAILQPIMQIKLANNMIFVIKELIDMVITEEKLVCVIGLVEALFCHVVVIIG